MSHWLLFFQPCARYWTVTYTSDSLEVDALDLGGLELVSSPGNARCSQAGSLTWGKGSSDVEGIFRGRGEVTDP